LWLEAFRDAARDAVSDSQGGVAQQGPENCRAIEAVVIGVASDSTALGSKDSTAEAVLAASEQVVQELLVEKLAG
jgi:hypothetical protein